jgi:hypothetical protein
MKLSLAVRNRRTAVGTLLGVAVLHAVALGVVMLLLLPDSARPDRHIPQRPTLAATHSPADLLPPHSPNSQAQADLPAWIVRAHASDAPAPWVINAQGGVAWRADRRATP